jgi:hypothetical protein
MERFRTIESITGAMAVTTAEQVIFIGGNATLHVLANNVWVNVNDTAAADATSFKLTAGMTLDLRVTRHLHVISDGTGGTLQIIKWKD